MLGKHNLQFTNATQLNDPFDCHPKLIDYSNVPARLLRGGMPEEWLKLKEEVDATNLRNDTWLCSLSKVNDSILMWNHYCYNHKGICIGLDIDKVMKCVPPMFGMNYIHPLVLDVQYRDIIERPNKYDDAQRVFSYQWETKAKEWEYEQEVRLVMPKPSFMYARLTPEQANSNESIDGKRIRIYMPLTGECFDSIYVGINVDSAERDRIIRFARTKLNPQIKLYQMRVDDNAFRLRAESIEK